MAKSSKSEANYTEHPQKHQGRCRDCTMERRRATACTAVAGTIKPDAHCSYFERKPHKKQ